MSKKLISAVVLMLVLVLVAETSAQNKKVNWEAFSTNLIVAIKSNHPGLQQSAMQRIIQYADSLDVTKAVYDIALIFRFDDNSRMRRLAIVTLAKINTDHALGYLCQYLKYEKNPAIAKQCCGIINQYYAAKYPEKYQELAVSLSK